MPAPQMPGAVDVNSSMEFQFPCAMDVRNAHPAAQPAAHQPDALWYVFLYASLSKPLCMSIPWSTKHENQDTENTSPD